MRVLPRFGRKATPLRKIEKEISRLEEKKRVIEAEQEASSWWEQATQRQIEETVSHFDERLGYMFAPSTCRRPEIELEVVLRGYTFEERAREWERIYLAVCVDHRDAIERARDARISCRQRLPALERELVELREWLAELMEERQTRRESVQVDTSLILDHPW